MWGSIAKWLGHLLGDREVPGSIPGYAAFGVVVSVSKKLFTLLQSTQLFKWGPGGLVSTREAAHPAGINWGSKCPTVLVLLSGVKVVVEPWVL